MKKLIIVLMMVAMASFLFVGCLPGVTPEPEPEPEPVPTPPTTVAPIIIGVTGGAYIDAAEAAAGLIANGTAPTYSEVKVYINGICAGTGATLANGTWTVVIATADLGADGAKTLYATAAESGLAVSAHSNEKKFTLDTVAPKISSSKAKAGTAAVPAVPDAVAEVVLPAATDTNDMFDDWNVNNAALLVGGTWKLEIKSILDTDANGLISVGDTITLEVTDPSGVKTLYSFGYPDVAAAVNYTTFIPGVDVDFPQTNVPAFNPLTFADIGAEVYVLVTAPVAAVAGTAGYIDVTFDEAVTGASILAGTWTAYAATNNLFPVPTVRSATVARLTELVAGDMVVGQAYAVSCSGIIDLAGNTISAAAPSTSTGIVMP